MRNAMVQWRRGAAWCLDRLRFSESASMMVLAVGVGLVCGLASVGFHELLTTTGKAVIWLSGQATRHPVLVALTTVLAPALGGLLAGGIVSFFARHDTSHGTASVMEAVALRGGRLPARPFLAKVLGAGVLIGSGGSAGPEDPNVQLGAVVGSSVGARLGLSETRIKGLVTAGVASAIAAAFNAPLAGVLFALEVVAADFSAALLAPVVLAAVAGSVVGRAFLGDRPAFNVPAYEVTNALVEIPLYALLGIFAAVVGALFIPALFRTEAAFKATGLSRPWRAALGGLLVGLLALVVPDVRGVGYLTVAGLIGGVVTGAWLLLIAKFVATLLTVGSSGLGGTFAPSMVLGAAAGAVFGQVVHWILPQHTAPAAAYALVGMGAVLAAVVRAPITAVLLLFEVTGDYRIILPIMACVVVSTLAAHRLFPESIYTERLVRRGIQLRFGRDVNVLEVITVQEVMTRDPETVPPELPIAALHRLFQDAHHHGFPVVDDAGRLQGIVTLSDLTQAKARNQSYATPVAEIASRRLVVAYPDQSLHAAMRLLAQADVGRLPVVDRADSQRLLGVLTRNDAIKAYKRIAMRRDELEYRLQQMRAGSHAGGHLLEHTIAPGEPLDGLVVRDLRLPGQAIITGIQRGNESLIARGQTILAAGDRLTLLAAPEHEAEVRAALASGGVSGEVTRYRELVLPADSPAAGRKVAELKLPPGVLIVALRRGPQHHTVNGQTVLQAGDELTLMAEPGVLAAAVARVLPSA